MQLKNVSSPEKQAQMVIEVKKGMKPEEIQALLAKRKPARKGIQSHVGKLKRGIDGADYQRDVRNEWN